MKQKLFVLLAFLCFCVTTKAARITEAEAINMAEKVMPHKKFLGDIILQSQLVNTGQNEGQPSAYYVICAEDGGFVVVANDDRFSDVLGFSENGNFDVSDIPGNFKWLLDAYGEVINNLAPNDSVISIPNNSRGEIAPMITTSWGQGSPYNSFCPTLGQQCVAGSVATAMAQVMNYYQWPVDTIKTISSYTTLTNKIIMPELDPLTISWDNMTEEEIARLFLYCGQSVNMDYDVLMSGAKTIDVATAMYNVFGYASSVHPEFRNSYSDYEWEDLLYNEIKKGRPILYSSMTDSRTNMLICDGYKDNKFHINWGCNGDYNGYFTLTLLSPTLSQNNYSQNQVAIIGIQKPIYNELSEDDRVEYYHDTNLHLCFTLHNDTQEAVLGNEYFISETKGPTAISNAGLELDDMNNYWKNIVVPSVITYGSKEYTVIGVCSTAFNRTTEVYSVKLPETIRFIGANAFDYCVNLESINIPSQVKIIEPHTFYFCHFNLKSIHLPENIETIGYGAFRDCKNLTEINIPGRCREIEEEAFLGCEKLGKLIIEDGTEPLQLSFTSEIPINTFSTTEDGDDLLPHLRGQFGDCPLYHIYLGRNIKYPTLYYSRSRKIRPFPPFERCSKYTQYSTTGYNFWGPRLSTLEFGEGLTEIADSLFTGDNASIDGKIEFPKSLQKIGKYAFAGALNIYFDYQDEKNVNKRLVLPENIQSVGYCAFRGDNIEELILPNTALTIEGGAFANNKIRELIIPSSVINLDGAFGDNPLRFVNCETQTPPAENNPFSDAAIFVPSGTGKKYRHQWPGALIVDNSDEIISINVRTAGSLYSRLLAQDYQVLDVTKLKLKGTLNDDDLAVINGMTNLYYLDLSEMAVEETPVGLFQKTPKLVNIKLPSTLTAIHDYEFAGCSRLTGNILLPSSCSSIGKRAFEATGIDGLTYTNAIAVGDSAFVNCFRFSNFNVNAGSTIGKYAFRGTKIHSTNVGTGATISESAFYESGLTEITLDADVERVAEHAFGEKLQKITFNGPVKAIDNQYYSSVSEVYVSNLETWCQLPFGDAGPMVNSPRLFIGGSEVKDIVIPKSIKVVRNGLFQNCKSLTTLKLSEGICSVGDDAFNSCSNLTSAVLPTSLTSIGNSAFANCSELTTAAIPSALSTLGSSAFESCAKLPSITFPTTLSVISESAFKGCEALTKLDLPTNITVIQNSAFASCSGLQRVVVHWDNPITISDVFDGKPSECFLYCPIGTATKYYQTGWNVFSNLKEAGILSVKANSGGTVNCYDTNITDTTEDVFFTPYRSFNITLTPDEGYVIKKVKLNGEDITSQVEDGVLFMEEPEENMTLSVIFADANIKTGDVNGDGIINVTDAICIVNHILKNKPEVFYNYAADANDDEVINVTDAIIIITNITKK
ncbi:MAG: leucine-rich repeat protein [Prevotella sp.]|nr:leucine-rich repeat protein [Prevotella sp.]